MCRTKSVGALTATAFAVGLLAAPSASADPAPGKEACKQGGYQALGFANQGQCVKAANQAAKAGQPFPPIPPFLSEHGM
jgi:hypothetical protein